MYDKPVKVPDTIEMKVLELNMKQLLNIVKALCDAPEKIQELEVLAMSTSDEGLVKMKKKRQSEQYQGECVGAFFNGTKVKKVGDIPTGWLWAWLSKVCTTPPSTAQVIWISGVGNSVPVRYIRQLATGIPDNLPMSASLMEKTVLWAFLTHCHAQRQSILNSGQGFFAEAVSDKGEVRFTKQHCCYSFGPDTEDDDDWIVKYILHNPSGSKVDMETSHPELSLKKDTKIAQNWDEWAAYVMIAKHKMQFYTLFPKLRKPTMKDMTTDVDVCIANAIERRDAKRVSVPEATRQATKRRRSFPTEAPTAAVVHSMRGSFPTEAPTAALGKSNNDCHTGQVVRTQARPRVVRLRK